MDKTDQPDLNGGATCANCRHVRFGEIQNDLTRSAICTRYPPTVVGGVGVDPQGVMRVITNSVFPSLGDPSQHWCSEQAPAGKRH